MKKLSKVLALVLAFALVLGLGATAFAEGEPSITINSTADTDEVKTDKTSYTWYRILNADIDEDPTGAPNQTGGKVAYYVTSADQVTELNETNLFNVVRVGDTDKWYVELKDSSTSAQDIIAEFSKSTFDLSKFPSDTFAQTTPGGTATSGEVAAGYYYITSTLGSKAVLQTLTAVTIDEKNSYVTDDKTIPSGDANSQIGQEITYTLTVNVPATANDQIVLTDTMSKGLTFKEVKSQKIDGTAATTAQEGDVSAVTAADGDATKFTITWTADQVKAIVGDPAAAKVITVEVTVIVNDEAAIDTDIPNTLDLKYGNNYEAKPVTVNTKTTKFDFDKVDGTTSSTKLTGAEFQLKQGGNVIKLVKVEDGKTYRVATAAEIDAAAATLVDTIVTNGNTITINGLDGDLTYQLTETKAPTGYNIMSPDTVDVQPNSGTFVHQDIENNKGATLPSTGGIGTTIFYIVGSLLVVGAGILLVTRKRMTVQ